jgi:hypothetical protein
VLDSGEGTEYATALIITDLAKWRTMLFGILSKNDLVTRGKFTDQTSETLTERMVKDLGILNDWMINEPLLTPNDPDSIPLT